MLDDACKLFAVRREWLDGAEPTVYSCHDFYKRPQDVASFLKLLKDANPDGCLEGVLIAPMELEGPALLVLSEVIGAVGERAIHRYHLCNNWHYEYWKSRAYLAACIAISWRNAVYINGRFAAKRKIERIAYGAVLLGSSDGDLSIPLGRRWDPEDMVLRPDLFLKGIDSEENKFGIDSALKLWLTLEGQGYMATGLAMYRPTEVRQRFQQELDKLHGAEQGC
ncbi:conserved hypothetical protein [Cupriavidus taiwanensis]|nr:conserved hypothetical protein [Cupriavidus taiwanensis]